LIIPEENQKQVLI